MLSLPLLAIVLLASGPVAGSHVREVRLDAASLRGRGAPRAAASTLGSVQRARPVRSLREPELPPPISRRGSRALAAVEPDPEPPHLAADVHFPTSNEEQHHLFRDAVKGLRGMFIGVGTDQNYLLAGWSKPQVLVLMDFDQLVVDLHVVYGAIFRAAKDPRQFLAYWSAGSRAEVLTLLSREIGEQVARDRVEKAYLSSRPAVEVRLKHVLEVHQELKIPTFLDDPAQYQYLVALFKARQVLAVRGDLTATRAVRDIAAVAETLRLPVRVLYLSNAERYFPYSKDFKQNMLALPLDARSVVLRTAGLGSTANVDPYFYIVQAGPSFLRWVESPSVLAVASMFGSLRPQNRRFLYAIDALPPPLESAAALPVGPGP